MMDIIIKEYFSRDISLGTFYFPLVLHVIVVRACGQIKARDLI